jgi:hypothetical protein
VTYKGRVQKGTSLGSATVRGRVGPAQQDFGTVSPTLPRDCEVEVTTWFELVPQPTGAVLVPCAKARVSGLDLELGLSAAVRDNAVLRDLVGSVQGKLREAMRAQFEDTGRWTRMLDGVAKALPRHLEATLARAPTYAGLAKAGRIEGIKFDGRELLLRVRGSRLDFSGGPQQDLGAAFTAFANRPVRSVQPGAVTEPKPDPGRVGPGRKIR